uniref:Uncharacterized protein n=1 Tax=Cyprinus carpio TaxID=7962 RepID=A0A8C2KPT7_CYPCA
AVLIEARNISGTVRSSKQAYGKGHYDKDLFRDQVDVLKVFYDPNSQENLTYASLIKKCTVAPETGLLLFPIYITFKGLRRGVTSAELLASKIIDQQTFENLHKGKTTTQDVMLMETVKQYLEGKKSIGGVAVLSTNKKMSIYQAMRQGIIMPGSALILLEAQAATGFMIDPIENKTYSVDEAIKQKLVGPEYHAKLLAAERAVTGYKDPYTDETISLFQALKKELIVKEHGIRLLEAQIATGGIIDPIKSHRVPVDVAYKRGFFDEEMNAILEDPGDDTKGFFDPNTNDNLTYLQLLDRCVIDPYTGLTLLPIQDPSSSLNHTFIGYDIKKVFKGVMVKVTCGKYMGMTSYKSKTITIEEIITIILEIIESKEVQRNADLSVDGLRGKVSILELLDSAIIDEKTYKNVLEGKLTIQDLTETGTVRNFLSGTSCIAGVLLQKSNQKMSIYQAKKEGYLTPGTALCLLEAQAATGFIIDPIQDKKLTVEEALKQKVIVPELYEKLLAAEKAVTGYKDPYTGKTISLFEAIKKDLIVKQHGIRLLEAQIATGGIIDPLTGLHLPLEVAFKKGYFDADLNKILADQSDDTKGFFAPTTQENLTYMEMLARCIKDPDTGLFLLPVAE